MVAVERCIVPRQAILGVACGNRTSLLCIDGRFPKVATGRRASGHLGDQTPSLRDSRGHALGVESG